MDTDGVFVDLDFPAPPRPDDLQESSIADPNPVDVSARANVVNYKIVNETSIRGRDKLFDTVGYSYTVKRRTRQCSTWRCTLRSKTVNCPATIRQEGVTFLPGPREHVHQPSLGQDIVAAISHVSKKQADEHPFRSAGEIVGDLVSEYVTDTQPCPALPALERIAANANYHRRRNRPQHPQDLAFQLNNNHIPDEFLRRDIHVDGARHLLFATDVQLDLLNKARTWYVDATFYVVRQPFYQLFTVNAFVRHDGCTKQLPLAMCVISRRRKTDYAAVFRELCAMLPHRQIKRMVLEFEEATWRAARVVFPAVELKGCAFHFTQAIWRRIQECGLQVAYASDDGTFKFLRKVMALCFLPAQHITPIFLRLEQEATAALTPLLQYVSRTWIESNVWPPARWSVYFQSVRTNNDLEGWHTRLNARGRAGMNLYMLVALLHDESRMIPVQVRLVSEGKLRRHQRKVFVDLQRRIFGYWEEYEGGDRSAIQLLRACARLYGPRVSV